MPTRSICRQSWHYVRSGPNARLHSSSHTTAGLRPRYPSIKLDSRQPNSSSTSLLSQLPQLCHANPIRSPLLPSIRMIHEIAKVGFASGTNDHYDKSRPSYPQEALAALHTSIPKTDGPLKVAELGSGTGLFTRALLAHPTFGQSVGELRAIEPSEGMRDTFNKQTKDSRVTCLPGDFLNTGVEDGWADLVVIAQAFHWCPDYDRAMAEFARILKPKGVAAFIWNLEDRDRSPWVGKIRDVIEPYEQGSPQFRLGLWKAAFDTPSYKANFRAPETKTWDYTVPTTAQGVHDRAFSKSYVAVLQSPESDKVHKSIDEILASSEKEWIDEKEGVFKYHYETFLVVMRKL